MKENERKPMIGAIRECNNRELLETMFKKFEVDKTEEKVDALKEAMYNPEVFFSSGNMDIEQKYETLVGAFLSGIWKADE